MTGAPDKARKREIARAYAERERHQGVFAVRCAAAGQVWVAVSRNLDTQRNATWFALRSGGHPNRRVQAAWRDHGEAAFAYEVLEQIAGADLTPLGLGDLLKTREGHWRQALGAAALVG